MPAPPPAVSAGVGLTLQAAEAPVDELAVKKAVSTLLEDNEPMGPTLVRLAWHAGGTYNKHTGVGALDPHALLAWHRIKGARGV